MTHFQCPRVVSKSSKGDEAIYTELFQVVLVHGPLFDSTLKICICYILLKEYSLG